METNFNFKSSVCTSREQIEKLLALGLKKETADCRHWAYTKDSKGNPIPKRNQRGFTRIGTDESAQICGFMDATFIPAWSLHRLIEMMPKTIGRYFQYTSNDSCGYMDEDALNMNGGFDEGNIYDSIISCIEWLIKEGHFPKEYLV